jgi:phosphotransferase system, enzyme I, PtsP
MTNRSPIDDRSLLLTLEESSRLVSHSHDPQETLTNIVHLIQQRFQTAVCSVYLLEPERQELVLGATVGLKPESVGRVRMRLDEGLTGLVAELMAPVMVEDAFKHPRFKYFPEAGEDPYRSFLGVPLIEGGSLEGVLVVQTVEPRLFSPSEIRMLVTVAAQVASLVGDAHLLDRVSATAHGVAPGPPEQPALAAVIEGVPLSPGSGLGQAYVVDGFDEWRLAVPQRSDDPEREKQRLARALDGAREEIARLSHRISEMSGEDHGAILQAQLMIMQDRAIERDLNDHLEHGASAEGALFQTLDKYVSAFQKHSTPHFQERVYDIKDVFHRLLWQLRSEEGRTAASGSEQVVLVAHEASVMELFAVDPDQLAAVVVEHGSAQSHAAILARSLGIPMVGQVPGFETLAHPGLRLFVDGSSGSIYLNPAADLVLSAQGGSLSGVEQDAFRAVSSGLPRVEANINLLCEAEPAFRQGVSGVGLFRSEFLFLARRTLPTEEEQVEIYRKLLLQMNGRPVSIRTFDLRPDKLVSFAHLSLVSARPFDWRRVLESSQLQQLFHEQVRAILRAGAPEKTPDHRIGPVRILVPLLTRTELLDFVLETVTQARTELAREGLAYADRVTLGVMIETAAAATLAGLWADHVDYFALGTNDLTASALGLDRDDPVATGQFDSLHPGLLRLVHEVIRAAHSAGRPVTVCGEMAADPLGCLALVALQVDALSVGVNQLRSVRRTLTGLSASQAHELAPELLRQRTTAQVRNLLRAWATTPRTMTNDQ